MPRTTQTAYFFKTLRKNTSFRGKRGTGGYTDYVWPPIGVWTPRLKGPLRICYHGYHLLRPRDLHNWMLCLPSSEWALYLVEAEVSGMATSLNKVAVRRARLVRQLTFTENGNYFTRITSFSSKEQIRRWMKRNGIILED